MKMNIFYRAGRNLFVNITNACPCDCIFCIRNYSEGYGDAEILWLEREPTLDEIRAAFDEYTRRLDFGEVQEIVFCGFGEPMTRPDDVIALTHYFKKSGKPVRINTNGLVRLMYPDFDMAGLAAADAVSVSLNADNAEEYNRVTRPSFNNAYDEMLAFINDAKAHTKVSVTIVGVLTPERVENCRQIARELDVPFRVR